MKKNETHSGIAFLIIAAAILYIYTSIASVPDTWDAKLNPLVETAAMWEKVEDLTNLTSENRRQVGIVMSGETVTVVDEFVYGTAKYCEVESVSGRGWLDCSALIQQ